MKIYMYILILLKYIIFLLEYFKDTDFVSLTLVVCKSVFVSLSL